MQTPITQLMDGASVDPLALRRSDSASPVATMAKGASGQEAAAPKDPPPTSEVVELARNATKHMARLDSRLQFRVDEDSGEVVVAVIDGDTSEVLRQIPAEEMLEVARRLEEQLADAGDPTGVLVTDSA